DGETLEQSLQHLAKSFHRLTKYKKVSKNLVGFMRATEVTVNEDNGSYNQHMRVLLCVESKYFRGSENYISQKEWLGLWKKALQNKKEIKIFKQQSKRTQNIRLSHRII